MKRSRRDLSLVAFGFLAGLVVGSSKIDLKNLNEILKRTKIEAKKKMKKRRVVKSEKSKSKRSKRS